MTDPETSALPWSSQTWGSLVAERVASSALAAVVDPNRVGGILILTSACDAVPWMPPNNVRGTAEEQLVLRKCGEFARAVPGGIYRWEARALHRKQSELGAEIIASHMEEIGIPAASIEIADYVGGEATPKLDPEATVRDFFSRLSHKTPDALVYFCGPSGPHGEWAFDWMDANDEPATFLLSPQVFDVGMCGPPGVRLIVSDAPCTADVWLAPAARRMGLAAWADAGQLGGDGGPPLARWLTGRILGDPPKGALAFPLPPDVGIRDLPAYRPLFWGPMMPPSIEQSAHLLWEVQAFVGACTRKWRRAESNHEALSRGCMQVVVAALVAYGADADEEPLLMRCVWLLHSLASYSPSERWLGELVVAFGAVLRLFQRRDEVSIDLFSGCLNFGAVCLGRCDRCRTACLRRSGGLHELARALALGCLGGGGRDDVSGGRLPPFPRGENRKQPMPSSAAAAARFVAQLFRHEAPEVRDPKDCALLAALQRVFLYDWEVVAPESAVDVRLHVAEALHMASLHEQEVKRALVSDFAHLPRLLVVLEACSDPSVVAKVLALMRSLALTDPMVPLEDRSKNEEELPVNEGTSLVATQRARVFLSIDSMGAISMVERGDVVTASGPPVLSQGMRMVPIGPVGAICIAAFQVKSKLPVGDPHADVRLPRASVEAMVKCLCKFPDDAAVQRWGLAAIGVLASRGFPLEDTIAHGIGTCVLWALGTNTLGHHPQVEQEALFCAHALMMHESQAGRAKLHAKGTGFVKLVAAAIDRAAVAGSTSRRTGSGGVLGKSSDVPKTAIHEAVRWGIQVFGLLAAGRGGARIVASYINSIVKAVLNPGCTEDTLLSAAQALSIAFEGSEKAKANVSEADRLEIVRCLQERSAKLPIERRNSMNAWIRVLVQSIMDHCLPAEEDHPTKEWTPLVNSDEEDNEVFPYELEKMGKKRRP
eukprot:TRINITY_DN16821_c0_g1_i1.p1 TRINITY_DN16821_c0_g1~~TRINITY_DN16821_c0_g1_i1.p1  ORF type:complete len:974 (+),score=133.59 TRINITY_DN16821_c0_g1_i1:108-2924(+)